jgi:hypothetical protein
MKKAIGFWTGLALGVLLAIMAPARADTIFQSALLPPGYPVGPYDVPTGYSISSDVFQGVRFTTMQDLIITGLGVRAGISEGRGNELLFLALVPLASPTAFPTSPTLPNAIFHGVFTPPKRINGGRVGSADGAVPTNFLLPAGSYSLIAGSGLFGATGEGYAPTNNVQLGYTGYFFYASYNSRFNGGFNNEPGVKVRFFVEGHDVPAVVPATAPEPGTLALLATGGLPLLGFWHRRRQPEEAETT